MAVKISSSADCGNSPRNAMIRDLAIAIASSDESVAAPLLSDEVTWTHVGNFTREGKSEVLESTPPVAMTSFHVESALSHGREGAAYGTCTLEDGTAAQWSFIVKLTSPSKSGKVRELRTFVIAE